MGRSQQFKLIRFSAKQSNGLPYMALFDMDNDPHETKNLADDPRFADVLNRESAAIDAFLLKFSVPPVNLKVGD
jgi:arylsulfatase A-like enzyme